MKRKLALFLVLALIMSLVPANVFAATSNSVNKVPSVVDDHQFTATDAPYLTVKESDVAEFAAAGETFKLRLENAEWTGATIEFDIQDNMTFGGDGGWTTATVTKISATVLEIFLDPVAVTTTTEAYVKIPLITEVQGAGVCKVTVDGVDSAVTDGTYTFAKSSDGDTKTTVNDTITFGDTGVVEDIVIDELVIGTFSPDNAGTEVELKLSNSDFTWAANSGTLSFSGGLAGTTFTTALDDNIITYTLSTPDDRTARGSVTISGLHVDADSSAAYGDVFVKVSGDDVTSETLNIGKHSDYTVAITADDEEKDLPILLAGDTTATEEEAELSILNIEEDIAASWDLNKKTKIEFPDNIEIIEVNVDDSTNIAGGVEALIDAAYDPGDNSFEIGGTGWAKTDDDDTTELNLQIYVSIEADTQAGDIVAKVSGKGVGGETYNIKLGKVVAPITATTEVKDVRVGLQDQATGNIVITEYKEAVLEDGTEITITLDEGAEWSATPTVKVTKGDVEIDDVEKDGNVITITIDKESDEASTLEISGMEVDLNRSVAEGKFNVQIGGNAIVKNFHEDGDNEAFDTDSVVDVNYIRVITPADANVSTQETVVFTIGAADYMVGATKLTADAAPFIDANNRTMLPVRAFANAVNVANSSIIWNDAEHSVVIFKGDRVIKVFVGQSSYTLNGTAVPMDTAAVIVNSRTFLPVRALGEALGVSVTWDDATKTVTIK